MIAPRETCQIPECSNQVYRDGLCAPCLATREAVRQDRERYKRTGELPDYVRLPPGPESESEGTVQA